MSRDAHSEQSSGERWTLHWDPDRGPWVEGVTVGVASVEVMPVAEYEREIFRLIQEAAELRATLNQMRGRVAEASALLTPGMKAGVAEAKAVLQETCS